MPNPQSAFTQRNGQKKENISEPEREEDREGIWEWETAALKSGKHATNLKMPEKTTTA